MLGDCHFEKGEVPSSTFWLYEIVIMGHQTPRGKPTLCSVSPLSTLPYLVDILPHRLTGDRILGIMVSVLSHHGDGCQAEPELTGAVSCKRALTIHANDASNLRVSCQETWQR